MTFVYNIGEILCTYTKLLLYNTGEIICTLHKTSLYNTGEIFCNLYNTGMYPHNFNTAKLLSRVTFLLSHCLCNDYNTLTFCDTIYISFVPPLVWIIQCPLVLLYCFYILSLQEHKIFPKLIPIHYCKIATIWRVNIESVVMKKTIRAMRSILQ